MCSLQEVRHGCRCISGGIIHTLSPIVPTLQFLEAYKSVTLESMAAAFGVSPAFMDAELAEFIVAGRVSAKIDKARPPNRSCSAP